MQLQPDGRNPACLIGHAASDLQLVEQTALAELAALRHVSVDVTGMEIGGRLPRWAVRLSFTVQGTTSGWVTLAAVPISVPSD